jgi:hypothetical protein
MLERAALVDANGNPLATIDISNEHILKVFAMLGPFVIPDESDAFTFEYPSTTQEIIKFRDGGISGTVLKTWTLNYTDATKDFLLNGAFT